MGFLLHSKLLAGPATLIRVRDRDSDSPRVYLSRWKKKKRKERIILQPSNCGRERCDDIRFAASVDKSSKNHRRLSPTVKQLPQSILTLVRFVVKKTFPSRGKGRNSQKRKGKQRNLPTTRVELLSEDAASSTVLPKAAAAPLAAPFTAITEERRVHKILYWKTPFSLIETVQLLAVPVPMHQAFQEVETTIRNRRSASTTNATNSEGRGAIALGHKNNNTNTWQGYRSSSRLWQSETWHAPEQRRRRYCIKEMKGAVAEKQHFLLKRSSAVLLLSRSICKRVFRLPRRKRKTTKDRQFSLRPCASGRGKQQKEVRLCGKNRKDSSVERELTPLPIEAQFTLRCGYHVVQAWEDKRGSVGRATHASLSLAAFSSSALTGEARPFNKLKGDWEIAFSRVYAGEDLVNERNNMQIEKGVPHPSSMQNLSPLSLVPRGKGSFECCAAMAGDKFPTLHAMVDNTYSGCTRAQQQRGPEKQGSLQICDLWGPCSQQGTRLGLDARNKADVLPSGDSRVRERVEVKPDSSNTNSDVFKEACTKEGTELLRVNSLCAGSRECASHRRLQSPSPLRGNSVMRGGGGSSSSFFYVEQNGPHRKSAESGTRRCGSYPFHPQTASHNSGVKQKTGSPEEFVALVKTASPTSCAALVHPQRSPGIYVNDPSLLCPRQCLLWGYYPHRFGSAHLSPLPCRLSRETQQAAVHPHRSILVEKNNILFKGVEGGGESTLKHQCQRIRARNAFWLWNCLPKKKSKKRRVRLRFETVECIAYYSVYQPPAASAFYRYTRLSTQAYFGDKALRSPLQPRKKGVKELKSGMTAEEAIQWSLSSKNARNKFAQCNAV